MGVFLLGSKVSFTRLTLCIDVFYLSIKKAAPFDAAFLCYNILITTMQIEGSLS